MCYLLFVAGLETTAGTIRAALWYLAQHPEDLAALVAEPAAIPTATRSSSRALSPVQAMARTLRRDTTIGGVELSAGDRVVLAFGAANRDPAAFPDPDEIRLDRAPNRHVAFGVGAHRCLGSNLARREVNVAMEVFLERLPRFELAEPAPWHGIGRLALRRSAPDQAPGPGPGEPVVLPGDLAGHDRGPIALGRLQQAGPTGRQVGDQPGLPQGQPVEVDHVEIGPQTGGDPAPIVEVEQGRGVGRHLLDHVGEGRRSPRLRSRTQWVSIQVGVEASQMKLAWAPPSARPRTAAGWVSISYRASPLPWA